MNVLFNLLLLFNILSQLNGEVALNSKQVSRCKGRTDSLVDLSSMSVVINTSKKQIQAQITGKTAKELDSAKVKLVFSIFGGDLFTMDVDICSLAEKACPIPKGEFSKSYPLSIPENVPDIGDALSSVPGAELEVKLELVDNNGKNLACIAVGMQNPASAHNKGIEAGTSAIAAAAAGGAFLASLGGIVGSSVSAAAGGGSALSQVRPATTTPSFGDVMGTFQFFASTGMLGLNYPKVYQQFSQNFGWSVGAISIGPIESALERLRGNQTEVNTNKLIRRIDLMPDMDATTYSELSGIESYAKKLNINPRNYFMTVLIIFMIVMAVITGLCLLLRLALEILSKYKPKMFTNLRTYFALYYAGNLLRVFALCYFILATAALYQFTQGDHWAITLLASLVLGLFIVALTSFVSFRIIRNGPEKLYSFADLQYKYGALYTDYRPSVYKFFIAVLVAAVIRAIAVGLLSKFVWAQMIILLITELIFFFALCFAKPYSSKASNGLMIFISVMRIINTALLFAFIESINLAGFPRTILGLALVVIQIIMIAAIGIFIIWSLFLTIKNLMAQHKQASEKKMERTDSQRSNQPLNRDSKLSRSTSFLEEPEDSKPLSIFSSRPRVEDYEKGLYSTPSAESHDLQDLNHDDVAVSDPSKAKLY